MTLDNGSSKGFEIAMMRILSVAPAGVYTEQLTDTDYLWG